MQGSYFVIRSYHRSLRAPQGHPCPNHPFGHQLFCPVLLTPVLLIPALKLLRRRLRTAPCLSRVLSSGCGRTLVLKSSWGSGLQTQPSPTSPSGEGDLTTYQSSKIPWHAASSPKEVHFSCKLPSVRGGILLVVTLVARAQQIPPPTPGRLAGRGGSLV